MKIENQVCSLELAKKLKELGVKQESLFYWVPGRMEYGYEGEIQIYETEEDKHFIFPDVSYKIDDSDLYPIIPERDENITDDEWYEIWDKATTDGKKRMRGQIFHAYTTAELGEMLPPCTVSVKTKKGYEIRGWITDVKQDEKIINQLFDNRINISADTESDCRAALLIYLIENKIIEVNNE